MAGRCTSVVDDAREVLRARALIELGARLQVLEAQIRLSRERLLRLYKELRGESPPRGQLPFSTDWFVGGMANVHSSLFVAIHRNILNASDIEEVDATIKAYRLYLEQCRLQGIAADLSVTRAWRLLRFIDSGMLRLAQCCACRGHFVVRDYDLTNGYACTLCQGSACVPRSRAAGDAELVRDPAQAATERSCAGMGRRSLQGIPTRQDRGDVLVQRGTPRIPSVARDGAEARLTAQSRGRELRGKTPLSPAVDAVSCPQ